MKTLIIYDSLYGNTEKIARAMGSALESQGEVAVLRVGEVKPEQLAGVDFLIAGSPTQRFNATLPVSSLLKGMAKDSLKGVRVAAFDTRLTASHINQTPVLAFFVRLWGRSAYAAQHIADALKKKGGELVAPPEGFYVEGTEGPLVEGEVERAAEWARQVITK